MKVSYTSSDKTVCPICEYEFFREEMHGGRGRIVADTLTQELRYTYKPSQKYGTVNPLLYPITVCPNCMYASHKMDFTKVTSRAKENIVRTQNIRKTSLERVLPVINFSKPRGLPEGIAAYYYALLCYQYCPAEQSPTFKQGLLCLRIAWLCVDSHQVDSDANWNVMAHTFYRKARYFYRLAWEKNESEDEPFLTDFNLGPSIDKNFGVDGVRYLVSYLEFQWGPKNDVDIRKRNLQSAKEHLSYIFGIGTSARSSVQDILTNAQNLYSAISAELSNL